MSWENIEVSSKVQGHISAGLYRTTGGALKELVNNAFDADASQVTITMNWPSFDVVSCRDNGTGIKADSFLKIMRGGIGDSSKRVDYDVTPLFNRPIIGRLGIGILGIAQICHSFKVISHHKSGTAFEASVKLADYLHEKMDAVNPSEKVEEKSSANIDVGVFNIETIPFDPKQQGTTIIATDMRASFVKRFREKPFHPLPMKFDNFLERIYQDRSIREMGDYWQTVWELAVTCPISYYQNMIVNTELVDTSFDDQDKDKKDVAAELESICDTLVKCDFNLVIDGMQVSKPIRFPTDERAEEGGNLKRGMVIFVQEDLVVNKRPLKMRGYIYLQYGRAIVPMELRGLLIRIRGIAIGNYDPTFLGFPKIEGPRFNWLSSEIYVEEGLDHALNIDRSSFNQLHPHYVKFQEVVHSHITRAFKEINKNASSRSKIKQKGVAQDRQELIKKLAVSELNGNYDLVESNEKSVPITIDEDNHIIFVDNKRAFWPKTKANRQLAQEVSIAFELAMRMPSSEQKSKFYELINRLLGE